MKVSDLIKTETTTASVILNALYFYCYNYRFHFCLI